MMTTVSLLDRIPLPPLVRVTCLSSLSPNAQERIGKTSDPIVDLLSPLSKESRDGKRITIHPLFLFPDMRPKREPDASVSIFLMREASKRGLHRSGIFLWTKQPGVGEEPPESPPLRLNFQSRPTGSWDFIKNPAGSSGGPAKMVF